MKLDTFSLTLDIPVFPPLVEELETQIAEHLKASGRRALQWAIVRQNGAACTIEGCSVSQEFENR